MDAIIKNKSFIINALCLFIAITAIATKIFAVYNITCSCNEILLNATNPNNDISKNTLKMLRKIYNSTLRVA